MKIKVVFYLIFVPALFFLYSVSADEIQSEDGLFDMDYTISVVNPSFMTDLIDLPTAYIMPRHSFLLRSDISLDYAKFGIQFGLLSRLSLSVGIRVDDFLGSSDLRVDRPIFGAELMFFRGTKYLPTLGVGYREEYAPVKQELGYVYVIASQELLANTNIHVGMRRYNNLEDDMISSDIGGFFGISSVFNRFVILRLEYDFFDEDSFNYSIESVLFSFLTVALTFRHVDEQKGVKYSRSIEMRYLSDF